jgi:hypothetical protein
MNLVFRWRTELYLKSESKDCVDNTVNELDLLIENCAGDTELED